MRSAAGVWPLSTTNLQQSQLNYSHFLSLFLYIRGGEAGKQERHLTPGVDRALGPPLPKNISPVNFQLFFFLFIYFLVVTETHTHTDTTVARTDGVSAWTHTLPVCMNSTKTTVTGLHCFSRLHVSFNHPLCLRGHNPSSFLTR